MNISSEETIVALATPSGFGAISLIRLSGKKAFEIANFCLNRPLPEPRMLSLRNFQNEKGDFIDQVVVSVFRSPASYTGEDVVEFSCHGGLFIADKILSRCIDCGARLAQAGEFTQRAFLNGKLDLSQAEAVMDMISANSEAGLRIAKGGLLGELSEKIRLISDLLVGVLAQLEAYLNFPDEDIPELDTQSWLLELAEGKKEIQQLLATIRQGKFARAGIQTVICGKPNVGKSSLLNALVGFQRVIVSPESGTTRDTVEERIRLGEFTLVLIDTAGIREEGNKIEQEGITRSLKEIESADLILEVLDGSLPKEDFCFQEEKNLSRHLLVINKSDLPEHSSWQSVKGARISCLEKPNLQALENAIHQWVLGAEGLEESHLAINERQASHLDLARKEISLAEKGISAQQDLELICAHLRFALNELSKIVGGGDTEEILGEIFRRFCIGK